ncbi:cold shock domain-containing protein [Pararcticibacter amylolyticus]|uniref:DNA-binding protein n=1 Tax=Pararcticibacter amylolyticus TaxID=2173175 RepID=A0A2U2PB16_9SPHI|nr:cold shock domain-containing protein [Pararcticibacter amylolyticus]PWG78553.1 DNA-binding protein [Pararcticibacter amylolyticus]
MGRSNETFNKKEKEKKRLKKQQDKKAKAENRKANSDKGKSLEDMMAYVDENGNLTTTFTEFMAPKPVDLDDIAVAIPKQVQRPKDAPNTGVINFYNTAKGFGFIRDSETKEDVFFHVNSLTYEAKENDKVTFTTERGPRGLQAVGVAKL